MEIRVRYPLALPCYTIINVAYFFKIILTVSFASLVIFSVSAMSEQHFHEFAQGCPISSIEALPCPREDLFIATLLIFTFAALPFSQLLFANIHRGAIAGPARNQNFIPNRFIRFLAFLQKRDPVN